MGWAQPDKLDEFVLDLQHEDINCECNLALAIFRRTKVVASIS